MGKKFTYTQLVFGSIAIKWFNLGQTFREAFHKLPTISWVNFGPFLLTELLIDVLRCCFNISTSFSSSWCHLFCEVHQSLLHQSIPTTWCCHPRASRLGWCFLACKPPPSSSKHNNGHYGQTVLLLFHQTRRHFSKKYDLCPHVKLQTVVWLFYTGFGAVASSLLSGLSGYVDIGLVLLWTFVPVSTSIFPRSFAVVLGWNCTAPKYVNL